MSDIKLIHFERSGGLTGLNLSYTVDTGSLNSAEAEQILSLINLKDLPRKSAGIASAKIQSDQFVYRIIIETEDEIQDMIMYESDVPEMLQPLIRYMTVKAKKKK